MEQFLDIRVCQNATWCQNVFPFRVAGYPYRWLQSLLAEAYLPKFGSLGLANEVLRKCQRKVGDSGDSETATWQVGLAGDVSERAKQVVG